MTAGGRYELQVLSKALAVLECLLDAGEPLNLEEVTSRTALPKSTAFRLLRSLVDHDLVIQTPQGFWLSTKFLRFGAVVDNRLDVKKLALPSMTALLADFNETVHLGVLAADRRVLYLDKLIPDRAVGLMMSRVGGTSPAHCTGLGKALLAGMPEEVWREVALDQGLKGFTPYTITDINDFFAELAKIRRRGYSIDDREHEIEVRCVAAPIYNVQGEVVATISVAGPASRLQHDLEGSPLARAVVEAARTVSEQLGVDRPTPEPFSQG